MARTKEFDEKKVLEIAIRVFGEHGYAGTSTAMLTKAMKIGRQSLYDTFGDKWQLYCSAIQKYSEQERDAHTAALQCGRTAIEGLTALFERVVREARKPCLGVSSISEFGCSHDDLVKMHERNGRSIVKAIASSITEAKEQGDCHKELDSGVLASFVVASISGIRIAARGGASEKDLRAMGQLAIDALR
jgi:TetR/AcrR family transcriptional regulator, transcriptional repressor for nem operon